MTVRAGIAGAGMVAAVHADAIRRAGGAVIGVAASTPERSKAAAARLGADLAFHSASELAVSGEIDVLHVCTPNALHGPLVRAALAAGKHVVCEKPLSLTGTDSDELVALAAESGLVNAVPLVYRYAPLTVEARERVRAGQIGAIRLIHGHYLQDWLARPEDNNWRVDPAVGGASRAFADIGSHWCDLVEWISGHRISELTAAAQTVLPRRSAAGHETFAGTEAESPATRSPAQDATESAQIAVTTEDAVQVLFRTDRGATGALVVSQVSPGRKNRLWFEIDGAERSVSYDGEDPESLLLGGRDRTEIVRRDALSPGAGRINAVPAGHPWGYRDCFAAFTEDVYAAIRDHSASRDHSTSRGPRTAAEPAPAYPTFADAARTAHITDAVLTSAAHRSWIEVS
ncbi:Gfo/Idh/MocA family oxidoreductase [Catenulispora sp. NF23]|uniref:Gfo/Idh/MocA family oxidoreductase n=1 Tax=Catenulispora pinistramenti TaxID=2705254 RepID=A0ABS5L115_9ACTN|nr:Gfo/Idh/MocA family oxidoreductase [Catenulispora pinistramenti]MBS2537650.1 Gfo/Idh/MocA family oxidoreductase [Catenulispora pinistramenti]MBS2552021.1 Gfo/Idh/MocA family oxidoreductase [Catenulispora pinistramenti]